MTEDRMAERMVFTNLNLADAAVGQDPVVVCDLVKVLNTGSGAAVGPEWGVGGKRNFVERQGELASGSFNWDALAKAVKRACRRDVAWSEDAVAVVCHYGFPVLLADALKEAFGADSRFLFGSIHPYWWTAAGIGDGFPAVRTAHNWAPTMDLIVAHAERLGAPLVRWEDMWKAPDDFAAALETVLGTRVKLDGTRARKARDAAWELVGSVPVTTFDKVNRMVRGRRDLLDRFSYDLLEL